MSRRVSATPLFRTPLFRASSSRTSSSASTTPTTPAASSPAGRAGAADVLLAAALWGTTGTVRTFAPEGAGAVSIGAARIILGGLLLVLIATWAGRGAGLRRLVIEHPHRRRRTGRWMLLAAGAVCVALYQSAFFAAVSRTGVATGTVVTIGSAPAFAGLLSRFTGGSALTLRWLVATAAAVAGCGALITGGRDAGVEPLGIGLALTAGLGYAAYASIAGHLIGSGHDDRAVVAVLFGGAGLVLLPVLLAGSPGWLLTASGLLITGYLGAITTTLGYLFYARGLRTTPVAVATTLGLAEPAVAALLGLFLLGEHLGGTALGGLALLAAGLLLLIVPVRRT